MKRLIQVAMLGLIGKAGLGLLQGLEIDLRKASLSRVCQPSPLLRKWSAMSASIRNVTFALVGAFCLPRVRRHSCTNSGSTSMAGWALLNHSASFSKSSGSSAICRCISASSSSVGQIVPGLSFGMASHLLWACLAQADDSAGISPPCVNNEVETLPNVSNSRVSHLTVPGVPLNKRGIPLEVLDGGEAGTPLRNVGPVLRFVPLI